MQYRRIRNRFNSLNEEVIFIIKLIVFKMHQKLDLKDWKLSSKNKKYQIDFYC